ncbi:hypothetical protein G6Z92_18225 [Vibrio aestuarianus subsp. cardii]|uniref:hypothetical protein n=1 Tax=Vibrio aestuarianus TaxID=28171 RepID=UPI0015C56126|nr:hypothetical protein [Vibrio aestuarianus]NGZ68861.1 hypothetical protein [Vibrio aestuarianus subsp. cardii]
MTIRVNNSEVVFSESAIFRENDEVWLNFQVLDWSMKVLVRMSVDHEEEGYDIQPGFSEEHGEYGILELRNWGSRNNMGFTTEFGVTQERSINLDVIATKVGSLYNVQFQFRLEDSNE